MKKGIILTFLITFGIFLFTTSVFAINVKVEKVSENEVWISDLNRPVVFDLEVTNLGTDNSFSFYNIIGFTMFPVGTVPIASQEVKDVRLEVSPLSKLPES